MMLQLYTLESIDSVYEVKTVEDLEFIDNLIPEDRTVQTDFKISDIVHVLWDDNEMYEAIIEDISGKFVLGLFIVNFLESKENYLNK